MDQDLLDFLCGPYALFVLVGQYGGYICTYMPNGQGILRNEPEAIPNEAEAEAAPDGEGE